MRRTALAVLAVAALAGAAAAQQSNFQIAPPPIPYPYFEPGRVDAKLGGTIISMSGTGVEFGGALFSANVRKAANETFAIDGLLDLGVLGGTIDSGAISYSPVLLMMNFGGNLELQLFKRPGGSLIAYTDLVMPISVMSFDKYFTGTCFPASGSGCALTPSSIFTVMFGMPVGMQAGVNLGPNWKLAPFAGMVAYFGGTSTFNYTGTPNPFVPLSATIDPFTVTSIGTDIIYVPWNLSLGTMLQAAGSSGTNDGVDTFMLQLSWHWRKS